MGSVETLDLLRVDLVGELFIATLLGGLIGLERELSGKPAGLRTNILICVGATLITDLSLHMSGMLNDGGQADASRLAAQIVSGIGFLGAGTIIQARGTVSGLTSAATLWVVAAIGIAIGSRHLVEALVTGVLVLIVLLPLGWFERRLEQSRRVRSLLLELTRESGGIGELVALATSYGLTLRTERLEVDGEVFRVHLELVGTPEVWTTTRNALSEHPRLRSLRIS